jgi:Ice-binding-like/Secretion system C-terminal sorting domain
LLRNNQFTTKIINHIKMKKIVLIILTAVILLFSPKVNFGQAPTLGTTDSFALFTGAGAFGNVGGSTTVTGLVGTDAGAFTAFPPGTLVYGPTAIHVADAKAAQAKIDVLAAYASFPAGGTPIAVTLGSGGTVPSLTPGVYTTGAAAATLDGNLILDAQGDPTALFIIKIGGAFATTVGSTVTLVNSAAFCNVYWKIGGQVDLGKNSFFQGTIIVTGAMIFAQGANLIGRGLATAGAISLKNNSVNNGTCFIVLPIAFRSLTATRINRTNVVLRWETAIEINNKGFAIERNTGNDSWELITFIPTQALGGNSSSPLSYTFDDMNSNKGITQYRIKQVDLDGRARFSDIRVVRGYAQQGKIIVYPNPSANGQVSILFEDKEGIRDITLSDMIGRTVKEWQGITKNTLQITNLVTGIYTLRVIMRETGDQSVEKIIVQ